MPVSGHDGLRLSGVPGSAARSRRWRLVVILAVVVAWVAIGSWFHRSTTDAAGQQVAELRSRLQQVAEVTEPGAVASAASAASLGDNRPVDALAPEEHLATTVVDGDDLVLTYRIHGAPDGGCLRLRLSGTDRAEHRVTAC